MIAGEIGGLMDRIARISVSAEEHHRVQEGVFALLDRLGGPGVFVATDVSRSGRPHAYGLFIGEERAPTEAELRAAWPTDIPMVLTVERLRGESIEAKKRSLVRVVEYALKPWPVAYGRRTYEDVVVRGLFLEPWTRTALSLSERSGATEPGGQGTDGGALPGGGDRASSVPPSRHTSN
jgi:hypothetical protein